MAVERQLSLRQKKAGRKREDSDLLSVHGAWLPSSCHLHCELQGSSRCRPWLMPLLSLSAPGRARSWSSTSLWAPCKHWRGKTQVGGMPRDVVGGKFQNPPTGHLAVLREMTCPTNSLLSSSGIWWGPQPKAGLRSCPGPWWKNSWARPSLLVVCGWRNTPDRLLPHLEAAEQCPPGPSCWQTGLLTCGAHEGTEDLFCSFLGFLAGSEVWLDFGNQLFPEEG